MSLVTYLDEEPNGLAAMIGGLVESNLEAHPERAALLKPAVIGILSTDAAAALTLRFERGGVTVSNGLDRRPQVLVGADSATLAELPAAPLRFGFPDALTPEGRALTRKLLRGDLRVNGLLRHAPTVSRLNRLLSVA